MTHSWRFALTRGLVPVLVVLVVGCSGTSRDGTRQTTRMYHVQVGMAKEKAEADQTLSRAITWWKAHADTLKVQSVSSETESAVKIVWKAPMYRVRLGPFGTAQEAERVLSAVDSAFPEAFVAPGRPPADRKNR